MHILLLIGYVERAPRDAEPFLYCCRMSPAAFSGEYIHPARCGQLMFQVSWVFIIMSRRPAYPLAALISEVWRSTS